MITVYYWAQHTNQAGKVFDSIEGEEWECKEDESHVLEDEGGYDFHPSDFRSVSAPTREELIEQLTDEIRVWSRWSMNAERAWEVKWRENAIAYIS